MPEELTERQQEIAKLVSVGLKDKEIGELLEISRFTVRNHITKILRRYNVRNRTELARMELMEKEG